MTEAIAWLDETGVRLNNPGVYMFESNNQCLYVGKSTRCVVSRAHESKAKLNLDFYPIDIWYVPTVTKADANILELWLISFLKPKFNKDCVTDDMPTIVLKDHDGNDYYETYYWQITRSFVQKPMFTPWFAISAKSIRFRAYFAKEQYDEHHFHIATTFDVLRVEVQKLYGVFSREEDAAFSSAYSKAVKTAVQGPIDLCTDCIETIRVAEENMKWRDSA